MSSISVTMKPPSTLIHLEKFAGLMWTSVFVTSEIISSVKSSSSRYKCSMIDTVHPKTFTKQVIEEDHISMRSSSLSWRGVHHESIRSLMDTGHRIIFNDLSLMSQTCADLMSRFRGQTSYIHSYQFLVGNVTGKPIYHGECV